MTDTVEASEALERLILRYGCYPVRCAEAIIAAGWHRGVDVPEPASGAQAEEIAARLPTPRMEWEHDRDCAYVTSTGPAPCTCSAAAIAKNPPENLGDRIFDAAGIKVRGQAAEIARLSDRLASALPAPEVTEAMVEAACEVWFGEGQWRLGYAHPTVDVDRSNGLAAKFRADIRAALTAALSAQQGEPE